MAFCQRGSPVIGAFRNMVKGFGPYNMKILGIILVATFSSLLAINHEDGMTSTMGILGAIVGYLFGIKYLSKINYTSKPLLRQTSGVRKQ